MLSVTDEMPVRVIAGSYRGQCGLETQRTAKMVYVEMDYVPTVQLMQCSVCRVIVERVTEPPTEIPEGSSKERGFRVGWHCSSRWRLVQRLARYRGPPWMYIGDGVCQTRWRGAGCARVSIKRSIGETMCTRSCRRSRARDGPQPLTIKQQMLLLRE